MKTSLVILFALSLTMTFGQSYKVITCTPGITVGTTTLRPGTVINHSTNILRVPKGGSLALLTDDGWLVEVTQTTSVDKLRESVVIPAMPGTIMDGEPQFYTRAVESRFRSDIIGDTLFMFWPAKHLITYTTFVFHMADMFDKPLNAVTTDKNWLLVDVSKYRKKKWDFIYSVSGRKTDQDAEVSLSPLKSVSFKQKKKDLAVMNARIVNASTQMRLFEDEEDRAFYQCAIYELNDFHYDQLYVAYQILSQKKAATNSFMQAYFDRLTERYGLSELRFD